MHIGKDSEGDSELTAEMIGRLPNLSREDGRIVRFVQYTDTFKVAMGLVRKAQDMTYTDQYR